MNNTECYENWQCSGSSCGPATELENGAKPSAPNSLSSVASPCLGVVLLQEISFVWLLYFYLYGKTFFLFIMKFAEL